jgi:hypothetical protein
MVWVVILKDDGKEVLSRYGFDITKTSGKPEVSGDNLPYPYNLPATWALIASQRTDFERKWNSPKSEIFTFKITNTQ